MKLNFVVIKCCKVQKYEIHNFALIVFTCIAVVVVIVVIVVVVAVVVVVAR